MTRKYHNHKLQTYTRHRDEEAKIAKPHDINKTIKVKQQALSSPAR